MENSIWPGQLASEASRGQLDVYTPICYYTSTNFRGPEALCLQIVCLTVHLSVRPSVQYRCFHTYLLLCLHQLQGARVIMFMDCLSAHLSVHPSVQNLIYVMIPKRMKEIYYEKQHWDDLQREQGGLASLLQRGSTTCIILLHAIAIKYCKLYMENSSLSS